MKSKLSTEIKKIRQDFPILHQHVHGYPLVYLDNAATTQKPLVVIKTLEQYYQENNANIHRGVHALSQRATHAYEAARIKVQRFMNATAIQEIIFTRGTTDAINLIAQSYGRHFLKKGDVILISEMEHHSNIVPWQLLRDQIGIEIKVIPMQDNGELDLEAYAHLLETHNEACKLVAIAHVSNALGTINPIKRMIGMAHQVGAIVVVDGAQAAAHLSIDVQDLDCDFYAFSSHKLMGPTGVGVLYGKLKLFEAMPPYQGGGEMIKMVSFDKTIYHDLPHKFEAGTPPIAGVIGLGAAIDYIHSIGLETISVYEHELLEYATAALTEIENLRLIGTAADKTSILSFLYSKQMDFRRDAKRGRRQECTQKYMTAATEFCNKAENSLAKTIYGNGDAYIHAHDVGTILDQQGIAVRTGHHCAMPVMQHFGIPATTRVSLAFYNTQEEIDYLVQGLHKVKEMLG